MHYYIRISQNLEPLSAKVDGSVVTSALSAADSERWPCHIWTVDMDAICFA